MAFPIAQSRVPTSIGTIIHVLIDNPSAPDEMRYMYQVIDQNGQVMDTKFGDEEPHITAQQKTAIQTFMATQRALAVATLPS